MSNGSRPYPGSGDTGSGTQVFRPSIQVYAGTIGRGLLVIPVVCVLVLVALAVLSPVWLLAIGFLPAFILVVTALTLSYTRWARVTVTPSRVGSIGFFGRRRQWQREDIATVLLIGQEEAAPYVVGSLYLLDRTGHQLLRLTTGFWIAETLHALALATGARLDVLPMADKRTLLDRYPSALPWWRRHPRRFTLLVLGIIAVVVVVGDVLFALHSHG